MSQKIFPLAFVLILFACSTTKVSQEVAEAEEVIPEPDSTLIPGTPISFEMAYIPGGTFQMGSEATEAGRREDEGPVHTVEVAAFWMGTHEVTFDEFNVFREKELDMPTADLPDWDADAVTRPSPPYEDPTFGMGKSGYPAVSMTQFAALQYCKWLSDKTGHFYRLPSEAEWEYACRAGKPGPHYFNGSTEELTNHAWYYDNSMEKYHKVGTKESNPWGLHDMLGNVSEWTLDQYKKDAYQEMDETMSGEVNPWIKPTRLHPRTVRGGSWDDREDMQRCACRIESSRKWKERDPQIPKSYWWNTDSPFVGFRIIRPAVEPSQEEQDAFWEMVLGG